jgi:hypothetical protein
VVEDNSMSMDWDTLTIIANSLADEIQEVWPNLIIERKRVRANEPILIFNNDGDCSYMYLDGDGVRIGRNLPVDETAPINALYCDPTFDEQVMAALAEVIRQSDEANRLKRDKRRERRRNKRRNKSNPLPASPNASP